MRAPTMATWTAGWASTQATASWAMVAPRRAAKARSAATTCRLRANPSPVKAGLCARQSPAVNVVASVMAPPSSPWASGP